MGWGGRRLVIAVAAGLAALGVIVLAAISGPASNTEAGRYNGFSFSNYKGKYIGNPNASKAQEDLLKIFPIGTPLDIYKEFYRTIGGKCFDAENFRSSNSVICRYSQGFLVATVRDYDVSFDPATERSTLAKLGTWLEGP